MSNGHKTPPELVDYIIKVGIDKATKPLFKLMLLGIFGGAFIALGGAGNIISSSTLVKTDPGFAKFLGAAVFPVGLILVVTLGAELFTSNCLLSVAFVNKKISFTQMIRNLVTVYLFNYVGSFIVAYITVKGGSFNADSLAYLQNIATHKVDASAYALFIKGILCNVLVCGAVIQSYTSRDTIGKLVGAWLPIMLFVLIGYDHSIANMFYLTAAKLADSSLFGVSGILYNLFYVTLGNILGALAIGLPLYFSYYKKSDN